MNSAMWTYFFLVVGVFGIVIINMFSDILLVNEQNYMLTKEITEAAMLDAFDSEAYRVGLGYDNNENTKCLRYVPGTVAILPEKFVENFIRRFVETATISRDYKIDFHLVQDCPPEVVLSVYSKEEFPMLNLFKVNYEDTGFELTESIAAILEKRRNEESDFDFEYGDDYEDVDEDSETLELDGGTTTSESETSEGESTKPDTSGGGETQSEDAQSEKILYENPPPEITDPDGDIVNIS